MIGLESLAIGGGALVLFILLVALAFLAIGYRMGKAHTIISQEPVYTVRKPEVKQSKEPLQDEVYNDEWSNAMEGANGDRENTV